PLIVCAQKIVSLENEKVQLKWKKTKEGYYLENIKVNVDNRIVDLQQTSGEYTVLYSDEKPVSKPDWTQIDEKSKAFTEGSYTLITNRWKQNLNQVALNTAGSSIDFLPIEAMKKGDQVTFSYSSNEMKIESRWK